MIIFSAAIRVLSHKKYALLLLVLFFAMLFVFVSIPVFTIAGNSLGKQLSISTTRDYVIMLVLAVLSALSMTFQIYASRRTGQTIKAMGESSASGLGAVLAAVSGTAFCASCLAPLFGFFGMSFASVLFVLRYRFYIIAFVVGLLLLSIYLSAQKIQKVCILP
jgi:hypothetical protein